MGCCAARNSQPPNSPSVSKQPSKNKHFRYATSFHNILIGVGTQYAFCRQFIFLVNAVLIGCGMALVASSIKRSDNLVAQWLGSIWYASIACLGGSLIISNILGCTGTCYQSRCTLIAVWFSFLIQITFE